MVTYGGSSHIIPECQGIYQSAVPTILYGIVTAMPHRSEYDPPQDETPPKPHHSKRFRRMQQCLLTGTALTAATSSIPHSPGHMALKTLQVGGALPTLNEVESRDFKHVIGDGFAESNGASLLPDTKLQRARINNFVFEPDGSYWPIYLNGQDSLPSIISELPQRANTTSLHAEGVAASFASTLENCTGREPDVQLVHAIMPQGVFFNGPHTRLLKKNKTVVNSSKGFGAWDPAQDVSDYKSWNFFAASNDGSGTDDFQPQASGRGVHAYRSVLVGAPYDYSTNCGPAFVSDCSQSGLLKMEAARIDFLPSQRSKKANEKGMTPLREGWGGSSNGSPTAAARFSTLMENYSNYLSEEQIFNATCYAIAKTTRNNLESALQLAISENRLDDIEWINNEKAKYYSSNTQDCPVDQRHLYDSKKNGFGPFTQEAMELGAATCEKLILMGMHDPGSITKLTTIKANLRLANRAIVNSEGFYVYEVQLPTVNVNHVVIEGSSLPTHDHANEEIYVGIGGLRIRVPVGNTDLLLSGPVSHFRGSTWGPTASGTVDKVKILSKRPLRNAVVTFPHTLGEEDSISYIDRIGEKLDELQAKNPLSLSDATLIDPDKVNPSDKPISIAMYPIHATQKDITQDQLQHRDPFSNDKNERGQFSHEYAYLRRREEDETLGQGPTNER